MAIMGCEGISMSAALAIWFWASIGGIGLGAVLVETLTGPIGVRLVRMPRVRWIRSFGADTAVLKAEPVPC